MESPEHLTDFPGTGPATRWLLERGVKVVGTDADGFDEPLPFLEIGRRFEETGDLGEKSPDVWYDVPVYYKSSPDSVVGPGAEIERPDYPEQMDYELEVAAAVGRRGRDVSAEAYVAGYTVFNGFSARDTQMTEIRGRLGPAKDKGVANAPGPSLVTPDEFDLAEAT